MFTSVYAQKLSRFKFIVKVRKTIELVNELSLDEIMALQNIVSSTTAERELGCPLPPRLNSDPSAEAVREFIEQGLVYWPRARPKCTKLREVLGLSALADSIDPRCRILKQGYLDLALTQGHQSGALQSTMQSVMRRKRKEPVLFQQVWLVLIDGYLITTSSIDSPTPLLALSTSNKSLKVETAILKSNTAVLRMETTQQILTFFGRPSIVEQWGHVWQNHCAELGQKADAISTHSLFDDSVDSRRRLKFISTPNSYDSLFPVRIASSVEFHIDAKDYFVRLSKAFREAAHWIFLQGWRFSPSLVLDRETNETLSDALLNAANRGVKIRILLYRNPGKCMDFNAAESRQHFNRLHVNIRAESSPSHVIDTTIFWAHHEKIVCVDDIAFLGGIDLCVGRWDTSEHILVSELASEPSPAASHRPRLPWHDIQVRIEGPSVEDLKRSFVERWNFVQYKRGGHHFVILAWNTSDVSSWQTDPHERMTSQIVRSAGAWSSGLRKTDHSIEQSYVETILASKHSVYMESQFFVSHGGSQNRIARALVSRALRAFEKGEVWHCLIVLPLLPDLGFDAEQPSSGFLRVTVKLQRASILDFVFGNLRKAGLPNPTDYIEIFGLRQWGIVRGHLCTELVYVHSKLLISDTHTVIIGSANINDRSMMGNRDSETCIVLKSRSEDGAPSFRELRRHLIREHLGVDLDQERSCEADPWLYDRWIHTAERNTVIYQQIFECEPDEDTQSWSQYIERMSQVREIACGKRAPKIPDKAAYALLTKVQGLVVQFPCEWMRKTGDRWLFKSDRVLPDILCE